MDSMKKGLLTPLAGGQLFAKALGTPSRRPFIFKIRRICGVLLLMGSIGCITTGARAQKAGKQKVNQLTLTAPGGHLRLDIKVSNTTLSYAASLDDKPLINSSELALQIKPDLASGKQEAPEWNIKKTGKKEVHDQLRAVIAQKSAVIDDDYNSLDIDFKNGLSLQWRAYDRGFGWRWVSHQPASGVVESETANWNLPVDAKTFYPEEAGFYSHNERQYKEYRLDTMGADKLASLPVLFQVNGVQLLLTESDLFDYSGMWVKNGAAGRGNIHAVFPAYPKELKITSDRDQRVLSTESYQAKINGERTFPWRVVMVENAPKDLLTNQLVYQFARPATGDYSWVKPGKVQWDWWHFNNVYNVPFRAGINDSTYMYYIDFAAAHNIEYVLLDEGWCNTRDLMDQKAGIHVQQLAKYAASKHVGVLLWSSWLVLDQQMQMALDSFAAWGIKGIKVDFMQRDDQKMVDYYEQVAREAAKRHLMVDFHGAYKPTGWMRSLPNVMTSEGVLGNEMSKFSKLVTPKHTVTIPFIRMAAGPMDFTPGGMHNQSEKQFSIQPSEPNTVGTRCNQMAMYVLYESPLQMLCDIPTHYIENPKCMAFLSNVPTVWNQSIGLAGEVGQQAAIAREALNGDWYIGAMTGEKPASLNLNLDFLPEGTTYSMHIWQDGPNADQNAKDFAEKVIKVKKGDPLVIQMVAGGGYVARLTKQ